MDKCIYCNSENLKTDRFGDIRCDDCFRTLERNYLIDASYRLRRDMSIEDAKTEIQNCIYKAACIIEALEHLGLYHGNEHHAAQDIAKFAVERFMKGA